MTPLMMLLKNNTDFLLDLASVSCTHSAFATNDITTPKQFYVFIDLISSDDNNG